MGRPAMPAEKRQEIIDLYRSGVSQQDVAKRTGVSIATVSRVMKRARAAAVRKAEAPRQRDIGSDADRLRSELLDIALDSLRLARLEQEQGGAGKEAVFAATVAAARWLDVHKALSAIEGLPADLPDDDDEARRAIRRGWWQSATRGGSATAMRQLAEAFGVNAEQGRDVELSFEIPTEDAEPGNAAAASAAGAPGDS